MNDITVMGLGLMGAALARAIQAAGHDLCVWNRSPGKMAPFVEQGAAGAENVAEAGAASPVILVCIDHYDSTYQRLGASDVAPLLAGKTIVQLTTGTPKEAKAAAEWMAARGAGYLDGAVMGGPAMIATPDGLILLSGDTRAHDQARPVLDCLVGDLRYLGDNIAAAATLDLAWLSSRYGLYIGVAHGARLCAAEGVGADLYATMLDDVAPGRRIAKVIHEGAFDAPTATMTVWREALRQIQTHAADAGISSEFPDFIASFADRAIAMGLGEKDVAAFIKVLE